MVRRLGRVSGVTPVSPIGSAVSVDGTAGTPDDSGVGSMSEALRGLCIACTGSTTGILGGLGTDLLATMDFLRALGPDLTDGGIDLTVDIMGCLCTAFTTSSGACFFSDNRVEDGGRNSSSQSSVGWSLDSPMSSDGRSDNS